MNNIYNEIYTLLQNQIFGGEIVVGSPPEMICTLVSTCAVLFLISLPFVIVFKVVRMICG